MWVTFPQLRCRYKEGGAPSADAGSPSILGCSRRRPCLCRHPMATARRKARRVGRRAPAHLYDGREKQGGEVTHARLREMRAVGRAPRHTRDSAPRPVCEARSTELKTMDGRANLDSMARAASHARTAGDTLTDEAPLPDLAVGRGRAAARRDSRGSGRATSMQSDVRFLWPASSLSEIDLTPSGAGLYSAANGTT